MCVHLFINMHICVCVYTHINIYTYIPTHATVPQAFVGIRHFCRQQVSTFLIVDRNNNITERFHDIFSILDNTGERDAKGRRGDWGEQNSSRENKSLPSKILKQLVHSRTHASAARGFMPSLNAELSLAKTNT